MSRSCYASNESPLRSSFRKRMVTPGLLPTLPLSVYGGVRLHCEDGAEPGPALRNAFIGVGGLRQWVSLDNRFDFPLRPEIKSFVEILGAVLLTADDADALHDEIHQRDGKWLRVRAHSDQPAVWT